MSSLFRSTFWRQEQNPMKRVASGVREPQAQRRHRSGFTLVEVMVASALILMIMLILIQVFSAASGAASLSRNLRGMDQRAAGAMSVLRSDLEGLTLVPNPPHEPAKGEGYLEIEENSLMDFELEDGDDVLAFTTRREGGEMFQGRFGVNLLTGEPLTAQSDTAEVIYFLRDQTLYRRQLLVMPEQPNPIDFPRAKFTNGSEMPYWVMGGNDLDGPGGLAQQSWYNWFDVSARMASSATGYELDINEPAFNTLNSLTKRENRYAHFPGQQYYPHRAVSIQKRIDSPWAVGNLFHLDNDFNGNSPFVPDRVADDWYGRPLLVETAHPYYDWPGGWSTFGNLLYDGPLDQRDIYGRNAEEGGGPDGQIDVVHNPTSWRLALATNRIAEDILLTNVLSFDIKVWDPGAPVFGSAHHGSGNEGELIGPPYDLNRNGVAWGDEIHGDDDIVHIGAYVDMGYGMLQNTYGPNLPLDMGLPLPMFRPRETLEPGNIFLRLRNLRVQPLFWHNGSFGSNPALRLARTYDTWTTSYESDGFPQAGGIADTGTNGIDDNVNGVVDEGPDGIDDPWKINFQTQNNLNGLVDEGFIPNVRAGEHEWEAPAPYAVPLRGIQIRIRLFDQTSNQAREYTLTHDF